MTRWTPELIDAACADYEARQQEIDSIRHEAYAEGRKDERESIQLVDWLGLALELEAQAKRVESKSAMRAMYSAARGLRLMGGCETSMRNDAKKPEESAAESTTCEPSKGMEMPTRD